MTQLFSFSIGIGSTNENDEWLEVYYPQPLANLDKETSTALITAVSVAGIKWDGGNQAIRLDSTDLNQIADALVTYKQIEQANLVAQMVNTKRQAVLTILATDDEPKSVPEAYLKLHLLSHRLVKPHAVNLSGIFASLPNIAWTSDGPIDLKELPKRQLEARNQGRWLNVKCVDKFPVMTDYVVPSGVRIAHTARVRLGAYIGEGTTIMHEGFVNFNAGTAGTSMIEGRVSAGVFVGEGSDLGGGCSTMGTLSGGGNVVIAVGKQCLIGANAGIGIALGDNCTVEAGLYITAGTKINLLDDNNQSVKEVKARDLSGQSGLLFRRNSTSGAVECKTNRSAVELNEALHSNN
ncbi:MAG: 2,3,4,5-tetrahydropyridine-2,6-dicarboxylate N-succinyltransferase [Cellvibrionales bacterium]|jgi:2,3,4,5-tetrahydropyridine-2-carboxylate N-succinyltransferase|nr:2,3,4,5-tetrahydropyridine-2,6-dicarboxylate N-succinyltransferase [Cellvibrionales bacterium]